MNTRTVLLLAGLLCWCFLATAQVSITNRQMYNFQVGDTIQWSSPFTLCWEQPKYEERVILGKQEQTGYVVYTVKDTRKYRCLNSACNYPDKVVIHDIRINDLDTAVLFTETPVRTSCDYRAKRDTIFTNNALGGRLVYGSVYYPGHAYACYLQGQAFFIEGIGEWYDLRFTINADACFYSRKLEFYHKVGEPVYGKRVIIPPSAETAPKLDVYPTLINDYAVHIDYRGEKNMVAQIYALDGRLVGEETVKPGNNVFHLNVNPGIYFVRFTSTNSFNGELRKILVCER